MIPLLTERLRLRALTPDDLDFVRRLHANPDLVRFIPSAITPDEATARRHLEYFMSLADHPVQGFSLIELRGADDDGARDTGRCRRRRHPVGRPNEQKGLLTSSSALCPSHTWEDSRQVGVEMLGNAYLCPGSIPH